MSSTQAASVTLTVSIVGTGAGVVTSYPAPLNYPSGIDCPSTCSAQFADGTLVDLRAQADPASDPAGFSTAAPYVCEDVYVPFPLPGTADCTIEMDAALGSSASIQVTFSPGPSPCIVPRVRGRTLAKAKALITRRHCSVGRVTHAFSRRAQKGRVISQNPHEGWELHYPGEIKLVIGKGRRSTPRR